MLSISVIANGSGSDRIRINNEGMGAGQVGMATSPNEVYYGGVLIGTWSGSGAPLAITFNSSADSTAVEAVAQNITFENISDAPSTLTRTVQFQLTDGDGGTSTAINKDIDVSAVNDAPVFDTSATLTFATISEDDTNNSGQTVASVIASAGGNRITDAEGDPEGIAIIAAGASAGGSWEYSVNGGTNWNAVGTVATNSALLLRESDLLRFNPDGTNGGTAVVSFHAWDQSAGSFGSKVDATTTGGSSALSTGFENPTLTVTDVNDAPVLDNSGSPTLTTISEDDAGNSGNTIAQILASGGDPITDVDSGAVEGIAISGLGGSNGTWAIQHRLRMDRCRCSVLHQCAAAACDR